MVKDWELTNEEMQSVVDETVAPDGLNIDDWTAYHRRAMCKAAVIKAIDFALRGPHMVATGNDGSDVLCIEYDWILTITWEAGR